MLQAPGQSGAENKAGCPADDPDDGWPECLWMAGLSMEGVCSSEDAKSGAFLRDRQPSMGSQLPVQDTVTQR